MAINSLNKWLGYVDRSYEQIKNSLISKLQIYVPEMTDYSESNIFVILISQMAGVAEMLNYYIDIMARESYLETAQLYSSGYKLTRLTDYRTKSYVAATVDLVFTVKNAGVNFPVTSTHVIPAGTIVSTSSGMKFITTEAGILNVGDYQVTVGARQGELQSGVNLGTTSGVDGQRVAIPGNYSEGTMSLQIGANLYELVNTYAFSTYYDYHFITEVYLNGLPYIKLGGPYNGYVSSPGDTILGTYETCSGALGNKVSEETITTIVSTLTLPTGSDSLTVTNPLAPSNGADIETLESIVYKAPLDVRTLERAVTFTDFEDLALLVPGVKHAKMKYCCGINGTLYIAPEGGGIATSVLVASVEEFFNCRKMFTITLDGAKAGTTRIMISADVYGKYRFSAESVYAATEEGIEAEFDYDHSEINRDIRLSDIIGKVESLKEVDYIDNLVIYTVPYARPIDHNSELSWNRQTLSGSTEKINWKVIYGLTGFEIYKGDVYISTYPLGYTYTDETITFTILPGVYSVGMNWLFTTYKYNDDIEFDDFTVPIIDASSLSIIAHSQNKSFTCKPNC